MKMNPQSPEDWWIIFNYLIWWIHDYESNTSECGWTMKMFIIFLTYWCLKSCVRSHLKWRVLLPFSILAICPAHLNFIDLITLTILHERYKLWSSSMRNLLHFPLSSLLSPNICFRILFTNTLSLHSSLNVRDHVSQLYSTTGKYYCFTC